MMAARVALLAVDYFALLCRLSFTDRCIDFYEWLETTLLR